MKSSIRFIGVGAILLLSANHAPAPVTEDWKGQELEGYGRTDIRQTYRGKDGLSHGFFVDKDRQWHDVYRDTNGTWHLTAGQRRKSTASTAPPGEKAEVAKTKQTLTETPKAAKSKPTPPEREATPNQSNALVGVWKATNMQELGNGRNLIGRFEIAIREDSTANKTLEVTNTFTGGISYPQTQRTWICKSAQVRRDGFMITIEWSKGELIDWSPRTISRDDIQSYGSPNPEASVYRLRGDELTRINDPNGVTYRRSTESHSAYASPAPNTEKKAVSAATERSAKSNENNLVSIKPLKKTYFKVTIDNDEHAFQRWVTPSDGTLEFRGEHIVIRVLDRDAIEIKRNGKLVTDTSVEGSDLTIE